MEYGVTRETRGPQRYKNCDHVITISTKSWANEGWRQYTADKNYCQRATSLPNSCEQR